MMSSRKKKTTKGRQKVEMKTIENEDALYVSFSKRRNGVFSKASELSTLCGAEVLILLYSPSGKPHTFGSPDVNSLVNRFFSGGIVHPIGSLSERSSQESRTQDLNSHMVELHKSIDALKANNDAIRERTRNMIQGLGLDEHEDGMTLEKLAELKNKLIDFKEQLKGLFECSMGQGLLQPMGHEGEPSSYALSNHLVPTLDTYLKPEQGQVLQESSDHYSVNSTNMNNTLKPIPSLFDPFAQLNPTRSLASLEPSELFQTVWSDQILPVNENPFGLEYHQNKPSSSSKFGSN